MEHVAGGDPYGQDHDFGKHEKSGWDLCRQSQYGTDTPDSSPWQMTRRGRRSVNEGHCYRSGKLAGRLFEQCPNVIAEFLAPLFIEAAIPEPGSEEIGIGLIESHSLRLELRLQAFIQSPDIEPLLHSGLVPIVGDDVLDVFRQALPTAAVAKHPETVPNMISQRAVFLNFVELPVVDDRERILLSVNKAGLERGIRFFDVDACRSSTERLEERDHNRHYRDTNLEAFEIIGLRNLPGCRRCLAEAVVPDSLKGMEVSAFHSLSL